VTDLPRRGVATLLYGFFFLFKRLFRRGMIAPGVSVRVLGKRFCSGQMRRGD
jgi:hypothetical protein